MIFKPRDRAPHDARRSRAVRVLALVAAIGLSACGGGNGSTPSVGGAASPGGSPPAGASGASGSATGTGSIRAKVTDVFGKAVARASVRVMTSAQTVSRQTDPAGVVQFNDVPVGTARVCADHPTLGHTCIGPDPVTVTKGALLDLVRQLQPYGQPVAAVLSAAVDPNGVSADGRNLDVTLRIAVTDGRVGESWFDDGSATFSRLQILNCSARTGQELAQSGPRCIQGVDGNDTSYAFGRVNSLGVVQALELPERPWAVGLLIDQSDAGLAPDWAPNAPRLFAARVFADQLLPDTGLVLAGFASDDPSGSASRLPQRPVTFFPVESPRLLTSRSEVFGVLDDLSGLVGGGTPLYEAIIAGVDFMAARTPPALEPVLVVLADGADSTCGTPAQCAARRKAIVDHARASRVQLFLVGRDVEGDCIDPEATYCLEIRPQEPLRLLSADGGMPLVVGHGSAMFNSPMGLVKQWLSGWVTVQDVRVRLTSEAAGAFAPGAVVKGELSGVNPSMCPMECWSFLLPFSVEIPR